MNSRAKQSIKGRCKVAILEEVRTGDYSRNTGRSVENIEKEMNNVDFEVLMKELMVEFTNLTKREHKLKQKIADVIGVKYYE